MSRVSGALSFLGEIYLLRVPLLTGAGIIGFCAAAFFTGAKLLLGNAFDINSYGGIFWVSLVAFLSASAVEVTWRLVRVYGPQRFFDDAAHPGRSDPGWRGLIAYSLLIALISLPVIGGAIYGSTALSFPEECTDLPFLYRCTVLSVPWALGSAFLGFLAYLACLAAVAGVQLLFSSPEAAEKSPNLFLLTAVRPIKGLFDRLRRRDPIGRMAELSTQGLGSRRTEAIGRFASETRAFLGRCPTGLGRGYLEYERDRAVSILPGHITTLALFALTFGVYVWIGRIDFLNLKHGEPSSIPTLCYVLLLFMLFCWGLSGLAFFLDRYRIPVFIPLVVWLAITTSSPGSDYFYHAIEPAQTNPNTETNTRDESSHDDSIIVVAASGGGIQAAAWTARVLTGLEEECREECDDDFGESIRLISSVSGGTIGTMYFVNEYAAGSLPEENEELDRIVQRTEESSLDQIAWGLLYPDLRRTFIPSSPDWDRGRALEEAWLRRDMEWSNRDGIQEGLSEWRADAQAGHRPAVIFNTTIVETGQRLPLATTGMPLEKRLSYEELFEEDEPRQDLRVVTAARLSAAFPYVSPAARADVAGAAPHIVDGGYYDNYGVSSLVEWLDEELEKDDSIERVLVLEIRGAPSDPVSTSEEEQVCPTGGISAQDQRSKQGWFYQAFAPVSALLSVRNTGQRAHNGVELDLLQRKWEEDDTHPVEIGRAVFEFDGANPPLSWHLTEKQKADIQRNWEAELENPCNNRNGWNKVRAFLGTQAGASG